MWRVVNLFGVVKNSNSNNILKFVLARDYFNSYSYQFSLTAALNYQ